MNFLLIFLCRTTRHLEVARVEVHSSRSLDAVEPFDLQVRESLSPFHLDNLYVRADFDADGRLVSVTDPRTQQTTPIAVEFVRYGTRSGPAHPTPPSFLLNYPA